MSRSAALVPVFAAPALVAACSSAGAATRFTTAPTATTSTTTTAASPAVARLQVLIKTLGHHSGPIDGIYGA